MNTTNNGTYISAQSNRKKNESKPPGRPIATKLNLLLCDLQVTEQAMRKFNWTVRGALAVAYEKEFDRVYRSCGDCIRSVAAQVRAKGVEPHSGFDKVGKLARIKAPTDHMTTEEMTVWTRRAFTQLTESATQLGGRAAKLWDAGTVQLLSGFILEWEQEAGLWRNRSDNN